MIELIFVIVILGILASVAIPRLAGTRTDAEVATTVANLRTILSDAGGYYVAHGSFGTVKWKDLTNVPLAAATANQDAATNKANLKVGEATDCIGIQAVEKSTTTKEPAHIKFTKKTDPTGVCAEVLAAAPVAALVDNTINYTNASNTAASVANAVAIGSTTSVY